MWFLLLLLKDTKINVGNIITYFTIIYFSY